MQNIFGDEIPDKLYKYMSWPIKGINRTKEIFTNKRIHLSKPEDFNDPFEFKVNYVPSEKKNPYNFSEAEYIEVCKLASEEMNKINQKDNWVTCMTKCPDNILMWSHYAAKHTGVCLELEILTNEIMTVEYDKLYPIYDIGRSLQENWSKHELAAYAKLRRARKSLLWSYEEEYRYVTTTIDNIINGENFVLLKDFAKITGVICGCKMENDIVLEVKKFLEEQGLDIPVKCAIEKEKEYGLDII